MKTRAAILREQPSSWEVTEVDLDPPRRGEVLVEMVATGLCHSDDHFAVADIPLPGLPFCGGHEGGAIVREVGPEVHGLSVGDHVVTSFIPACGHCRFCAAGQQHLCQNGAAIATGVQLDGTFRMHLDGADVATMSTLGTFAEFQVLDELSCVKVPNDLPLDVVCLLACGVPTGWGAAVNAGAAGPGDVVVVIGCGGVGINAVQGAAHVGAAHVIAVDPVPFKRETALKLGATEAFASLDEAMDIIRSLTNGQGADVAVVAVGVTDGTHIASGFGAIRKGGTVVAVGMGKREAASIPVSLAELTLFEKRIQGTLYGGAAPRTQIPLLIDLYRTGKLKLDELATTRYALGEINDAVADLRGGRNIRGVIDFT